MNSLKKQKLIFNKRLRKKEMKMRLVIIVLGLLWSGNAWTEKNLNFLNIKLNKKVTDFFQNRVLINTMQIFLKSMGQNINTHIYILMMARLMEG